MIESIKISMVLGVVGLIALLSLTECTAEPNRDRKAMDSAFDSKNDNKMDKGKNDGSTEIATFGAGCFWCVEAVFQELKGVKSVKSGYMGGEKPDPTYKEVCTGTTGHAEVAQIEFDPSSVSFDELLEVFWSVHDPTTLNRQGNDTGTQYRSAVFYHSDEQKEKAEHYKKRLTEEKAWDDPIVTEISKASEFFVAEDYHQNYFKNNPDQSYCAFVVAPKVEKFRKVFKDKLKK